MRRANGFPEQGASIAQKKTGSKCPTRPVRFFVWRWSSTTPRDLKSGRKSLARASTSLSEFLRCHDVSRQTNQRYLDALAFVDGPTPAIQQLDDITARKNTASGRGVRVFNPLSRDDTQIFQAMTAGEHCMRGLSNADIGTRLEHSQHLRDLAHDPKHQSVKVSRILNCFNTHKLIAKLPRTRGWRVTHRGEQIRAASSGLRDVAFPELFRKIAAA